MPETPPKRRHWAAGVDGSFAQLIFTARKTRGWSQDELADRAGVSRPTILRWENGYATAPSPAAIRAVCAALDIDPKQALLALGYLTVDDLAPAA